MSLSYLVTINHISGAVFVEPESFPTIDDALTYLIKQDYYEPPATPCNAAYIALDSRGLARLYISPATTGFVRIAKNIESIFIRREDIHLRDMAEPL